MPVPARRRSWTAARVLRAMLAAQCVIALMVVAGDLPAGFLGGLAGTGSPSTEVPVTPGNQTRRFEPDRLPMQLPTGPGFPAGAPLPPRLEFSVTGIGDRSGVALLTGGIEAGDALRFDAWLKGLPKPPDAFALHSPGGLVDEALKIGRIIRDSGLPVMVAADSACFSACPYILAGGAAREVSRQAQVGVHQHYFDQNVYLPAFLMVSDIQHGQGELMGYLAEMGVDPLLMAKALVTPPGDIYILMPEELDRFRLATVLTD
jgi:hypothetical protein